MVSPDASSSDPASSRRTRQVGSNEFPVPREPAQVSLFTVRQSGEHRLGS